MVVVVVVAGDGPRKELDSSSSSPPLTGKVVKKDLKKKCRNEARESR